MLIVCRLLTTFLILFCLIASAMAADERRVALVIGNSSYHPVGALANPKNDAEDVSAELKRIGFQVIDGIDLEKRSMEANIARFARLAQDADVALFFFAGHGIQYQGQNYLMPIDAKLEDEFSLQFEMTKLDDVISALGRARGLKILMLDACRNNPLADRLSRMATTRSFVPERGLARLEHSEGMIVVFATLPNQVAIDGTGRNSPFTSALVRQMKEPGVEIGTMLRRVQWTVNRETNGRQTPEITISSLGEFYFTRAESDLPEREQLAREYEERERRFQEQVRQFEVEQRRLKELAAQEQAMRDRLTNERVQPPSSVSPPNSQPNTDQPASEKGVPSASLAVGRENTLQPSTLAAVGEIQTELKRLGCFIGKVDKNWTSEESVLALQNLRRYANLEVPKEPTLDFLNVLKNHKARVCPPICGRREMLRGGRCVAKVCPAGQVLDGAGNCVQVRRAERKVVSPKAAEAPVRRPTAATPAKRCITLYGQSFCE